MHRCKKSALALAMTVALSLLAGCSQASTRSVEDQAPDEGLARMLGDAGITTRIKTTYLFNPHLNSFRIDVDTRDGVVQLEGVVKSGIQKDLAGEIAKNASGVRSVENRLQVGEGAVDAPAETDRTFSQAVLDATTTASVKSALAMARGVKASEINVSTRWGTVTLTGTVGTRAEVELAKRTAADTSGVKEVVSQLQVGS